MKISFLIVIVLYKQKLNNSDSYISIQESLKNSTSSSYTFYIHDNSPKAQVVDSSLYYTHDAHNSGLSKAYNSAALYAQENNIEWLILLDQDTIFPYNYLKLLEEAILLNQEIKLFAPIVKIKDSKKSLSPLKAKVYINSKIVNPIVGSNTLQTIWLINSGLVIHSEAFIKVGGYNKKIKLDFADHEFINKFKKTYSNFFLLDCIAYQDFSANDKNYGRQLQRFKLFLQDLRNYTKTSLSDKYWVFYIVFRHALTLSLKKRKLIFLKLFFTNYLFKKA